MNTNRVQIAVDRFNRVVGFEKLTFEQTDTGYIIANDNDKILFSGNDLLKLHHNVIAMVIGAEECLAVMQED